MKKSITKLQKNNERLVRETLGNNYCTFNELYSAFFPKHFWQNRFTSWQKERDDFFKSFKTERDSFKENYKSILADAVEKEASKKQLKKSSLNNNSIFERKVLISNETIITVYFSYAENQTIGIYQTIKFHKSIELDWNKSGLLQPSSFIGCFCIKKTKFKNFYLN